MNTLNSTPQEKIEFKKSINLLIQQIAKIDFDKIDPKLLKVQFKKIIEQFKEIDFKKFDQKPDELKTQLILELMEINSELNRLIESKYSKKIIKMIDSKNIQKIISCTEKFHQLIKLFGKFNNTLIEIVYYKCKKISQENNFNQKNSVITRGVHRLLEALKVY